MVAVLLAAGRPAAAAAAEIRLSAAPLQAVVKPSPDDPKLIDGATVRLAVTVTATERRDEAEINLVLTGGRILSIDGSRLSARGEDGRRTVTLERLRRGQAREITIVLRLGGGSSSGDDGSAAALQITLRDPDSSRSDERSIDWRLTLDATTACARGYHKALAPVRDGPGGRMMPAQTRLRAADASLPGRWLLVTRQDLRGGGGSSRCLRRVERGGRLRCAKWGDAGADAALMSTTPTRDERALFASLSEFVSRKAYAPEFGDNGRLRWLTLRVASNLGSYLRQPPLAGLCAGGPEMVAFYRRQMGLFDKRSSEVKSMAVKARELARLRVAAAFAIADKRPPVSVAAVTPAAAASPAALATSAAAPEASSLRSGDSAAQPPAATVLSPPARAVPDSYAAMITALAEALLPAEKLAPVKQAAAPLDAMQALIAVRDQPQQAGGKTATSEVTLAVTAALRVIEAGVYADMQQDRYDGIGGVIGDTLNGIDAAHKKACGCK